MQGKVDPDVCTPSFGAAILSEIGLWVFDDFDVVFVVFVDSAGTSGRGVSVLDAVRGGVPLGTFSG